MTQSELKKKLYDLVRSYFSGATVVWGMLSGAVNPSAPLVMLRMGDITRPYQPIKRNVNGVLLYSYPSETTVQIDLFTKGASRNNEAGVSSANENTAVNDLTDFVNFINSAYVDDWSGLNDVSILVNRVRDLTELISDTTWEYRAMAEMEIRFTQTAAGHGGFMYEGGVPLDENGNFVSGTFANTPSGGRSPEIADQSTGWFEQVEKVKEE